MILEFDLGNSRFKWRLLESPDGMPPRTGNDPSSYKGALSLQSGVPGPEQDRILDRGVVNADAAAIREMVAALGAVPQRVRGSSVASVALDNAVADAVRNRWGIDVEFARSSAGCAGVRNGYIEPARLGVDRWLALVAAYRSRGRPVLVVDAGSALTMDLVDAAGLHRGGYIVPGRQMLLDGLRGSTARVRFDSVVERAGEPGRDTASAVEGGVRIALYGALRSAIDAAAVHLDDFDLVITGGDADWLLHEAELCGLSSPELSSRGPSHIERIPDLVMDGLRWAVP